MVDAVAVRGLARRVEVLAQQTEAETRALQAQAHVDWEGAAAEAYWWAVEDALVQSLATQRSLDQAVGALLRHAATVEEAEEQRRLVAARVASWAVAGLLGP
jgi:uncharacterized protein YukE